MLANLPKWQSSLLVHLGSIQTVDRLTQLLGSGDKLRLYLVSDGGAKGDIGSFGWELAIGRMAFYGPVWDPLSELNRDPSDLNPTACYRLCYS